MINSIIRFICRLMRVYTLYSLLLLLILMKIIGCIEANITFIAEIIAQVHGNYYSRRKFVDRKNKHRFIQRSFVIVYYRLLLVSIVNREIQA